MTERKCLGELVGELRDQAGWWLAWNSITRDDLHEEEKLRPKSMIEIIVNDYDPLEQPSTCGYTDQEEVGILNSTGEMREQFSRPIQLISTINDMIKYERALDGHLFESILIESVRVEGSDGRYILDFLASLWPKEWLQETRAAIQDTLSHHSSRYDQISHHSSRIFSPFDVQSTTRLLALSRFLTENGLLPQRDYKTNLLEKTTCGRVTSCDFWGFEEGKGLYIKRAYTIRLLIACWLPPFLVILGLCVLHLLNPDIGLGDILSLVGALLSALAAWIPGVMLKGWQLVDAVRGTYYTTNLNTAQEVSKSKAFKFASWSPSIQIKTWATLEAHLEPAILVSCALGQGKVTVVGNGKCYFDLIRGQPMSFYNYDTLSRYSAGAPSFSPLEITCNGGVPLEILLFRPPLGELRIPYYPALARDKFRQGRPACIGPAYIASHDYKISQIKRTSVATVHLEEPWQANLATLQVFISPKTLNSEPYRNNGQARNELKLYFGFPLSDPIKSKLSRAHFDDLRELTQAVRGGNNLLIGAD
ncbi:hypothetical protein MJO28_016463 [Puccinia striiformis f. sp. tritici]|uniref:Uncharacterized protein n=1 Tax=Puccinia striiformis f. sp. tritici TaxID=168172 RepID=A0ACC0DN95_9BASI|nr:hypothetical protein MJO28_016463 [Puccinia striiformis f. sp. tritici]